MKRNKNEIFYDYCCRRLLEKEIIKEKLKPKMFHCACILKNIGTNLKPNYVKQRVKGTYVKAI